MVSRLWRDSFWRLTFHRVSSDRQKDGQLCYKEMSWIDTWMNEGPTKKALGVPPNREFASCNMEVNQAFFGQGDGMHNAALLLVPLINDGVRLLVYAGNAGESPCID